MDSDDKLLYAAFERVFKQHSYVFKDKSALAACVHLAQEFDISAEEIVHGIDTLKETRCGIIDKRLKMDFGLMDVHE
eukprot:879961-Pelagomonas_calceolata.AAC.2